MLPFTRKDFLMTLEKSFQCHFITTGVTQCLCIHFVNIFQDKYKQVQFFVYAVRRHSDKKVFVCLKTQEARQWNEKTTTTKKHELNFLT